MIFQKPFSVTGIRLRQRIVRILLKKGKFCEPIPSKSLIITIKRKTKCKAKVKILNIKRLGEMSI